MASNEDKSLFKCTGCHEELDLASKTLPCLHSFCRSCLDNCFEDQPNSQCPECHEPLTTLDELSLSPFLVKTLRRLQLESIDWKCDLCSEDGIETAARNWCHDCQKLHCANCSRIHNKLMRKHSMRDLSEMKRCEAIEAMTTDMCYLHQEAKNAYCEQCNICLCDTCYQKHSNDSPGCPSCPLSVRDEVLNKKSQGPILAKQMDNFEMSLSGLIERTRNYPEELDADCNSKCKQLWENFAEMMENAKRETDQLCEEMRRITTEQVKLWRNLLEENEKILKQFEIWRLNFNYLLRESEHDVDVVCGLRSLGSKLASWLDKSVGPEEMCQLRITFPNWWLQFVEQVKSEKIGSVSLTGETLLGAKKPDGLPGAKKLELNKQWSINRCDLEVSSIFGGKEEDYVFICDANSKSIILFTEGGKFVSECPLVDGKTKLEPIDICSNSPNSFVVLCGPNVGYNKFIFLERIKMRPFLKINKILATQIIFTSMCQINETIFICDSYLEIYSLTKEGNLATIRLGTQTRYSFLKMCADPSNKKFWVATDSAIFCFTSSGEKILSMGIKESMMRIKEIISRFCVDEFGNFYFCTLEGIFSFSPTKMLLKFEEEHGRLSSFLVSKNKIFISFQIDEQCSIKIFKILD